ncbi:MAG: cell wall metabolism sensor histidine kinase WalK [Chloroflexi bacterium]|nr:cell wall metabolism sensor histidine kinase WalK [Chloroflexota bacterium]
MEAHNGRIWVESENRSAEMLPGSTFHLLLPLQPNDAPPTI